MDTIDAYENDIALQLDLLGSFRGQAALPPDLQKKSVFCGSGDSLSAAMLAESFSDFAARSADPLDLARNGEICRGKRLYLVSVSGDTVSNIRASATASRSVAVTAAKDSRLARACSETVLLDYPSSGVFTAGSVGFLASALACISLVSEIRMPDFERLYRSARRDASGCTISGNAFVLGNYLTYPVAMYCAAKFHEILGSGVRYERIEQFSHTGLFSSSANDTVIIFEEETAHNERLARNLRELHLNVIRPDVGRGDRMRQVLYLVFFSQFLALDAARSKGIRDCHFVTAKRARDASSDMIY